MLTKALEHQLVPLVVVMTVGVLSALLFMMPYQLAAQEQPTIVHGVKEPGGTPAQSNPAAQKGPSVPRDIFIDFDDLVDAPCLFLLSTRLTDRYTPEGVTFAGPGGKDGGAILNQCSLFGVSGHSAPNFLAFNTGIGLFDGGVPRGPETLHFSRPVRSVEIKAARGGSVTLEAFDTSNILVDSTTLSVDTAMKVMVVQGNGIIRVVVSFTASTLVLDDLGFDFDLTLTGPTPGTASTNNTLTAAGATPGAKVYFLSGKTAGSTAVPGCPGESVDIASATVDGTGVANGSGVATFSRVVPASASGNTFRLQAVEVSTCRASNLVIHTFP